MLITEMSGSTKTLKVKLQLKENQLKVHSLTKFPHTQRTSWKIVFLSIVKNIPGALSATRQVQQRIPGLQNYRNGMLHAFPLKADIETFQKIYKEVNQSAVEWNTNVNQTFHIFSSSGCRIFAVHKSKYRCEHILPL